MTSSIMHTYRRWPVSFVSGSGCKLVDTEGREYLDLIGGLAVCSVGHSHPHVVEAIAVQASSLIHVSNLYETGPQEELARKLSELTGGMVSFFCNSGAEAIECALKLARKRGSTQGRWKIVTAEGSFHGRTFGALSATGQPGKRVGFEPVLEGFIHVPFGDIEALEAAVDDQVAAVLLEPIQGEAGVVVAPQGYLSDAAALCRANDVLLILDEIQTGLGRTGEWWAHQHDDVHPDIVCVAKALASGLPMGACLATSDVAAVFQPGDHASTFGGGPVQSAAALATLEVLEKEGLVQRARTQGQSLQRQLSEALPGCETEGRGLLLAVDLGDPVARRVTQRALERGVLVNDVTDSRIRLAPPLVIEPEEIVHGVKILGEVWDEARQT